MSIKRILEEIPDCVLREWFWFPASVANSFIKEEVINIIQRIIAGAIELESFFYVRCLYGINHNCGNVSGPFSNVFVADRSLVRPATLLYLFQHETGEAANEGMFYIEEIDVEPIDSLLTMRC